MKIFATFACSILLGSEIASACASGEVHEAARLANKFQTHVIDECNNGHPNFSKIKAAYDQNMADAHIARLTDPDILKNRMNPEMIDQMYKTWENDLRIPFETAIQKKNVDEVCAAAKNIEPMNQRFIEAANNVIRQDSRSTSGHAQPLAK